MTGTCYNFEMEDFFYRFCVARVCQHQLGFLVFSRILKILSKWYEKQFANFIAYYKSPNDMLNHIKVYVEHNIYYFAAV